MRREPFEEGFEEAVRRQLQERAASIEARPDPVGLARRIEQQEAGHGRGHLLLGAAVVVAAAAIGGGVGIALAPKPAPQRLFETSKSGNEAGPLPQAPAPARSKAAAGSHGPAPSSLGLTAGLARMTASGTSLSAVQTRLSPVSLESGSSLTGCFRPVLVSTAVTGEGVTSGSIGAVGLQPLAANGLELVDSGTAPALGGKDLWWATVAVGGKVARVAAEQPNGGIDAMKPVDGLAVLGGVVPTQLANGFFSLVAETPAGQTIHSIGFLAGWGPKAWGAGSPQSALSLRACPALGGGGALLTTTASQPAAPLLAGSSVLASFHQAYSAGLPAGVAENMAAVAGGRGPLRGAGAGEGAGRGDLTAAGLAAAVQVAKVAFVSADRADVVYREAAGPWQTGTAVLGPTGLWKVSRSSFCGSLSGALTANRPSLSVLERACRG